MRTGIAQVPAHRSGVALLAARPWSAIELVPVAELDAVIAGADDEALARHPAVLLHLARALDPGMRFERRSATLDRLDGLLRGDRYPRRGALALEVSAERAIDASRNNHLDEAEALAQSVLAEAGEQDAPGPDPAHGDPFAADARAREALGRSLAWRGDRHSSVVASRWLDQAAAAYRRLGSTEWEGAVHVWTGQAVHFQWGDLDGAEQAMSRGFAILADHSPRRAVLLTFYADVLLTRGRSAEVESVLGEAASLAVAQEDLAAVAYVAWVRARLASLAGDATGTVRWLVEVDRHRADWWTGTSGPNFLADAAELLDRVGEHAAADAYLAQATERDADDEYVAQAVALVAARRGDPVDALVRLRRLAHSPWLEKRLEWRRSLFEAYATLRARRDGSGSIATRALQEAVDLGGVEIATIGEPTLVEVLAPLAAIHGSRTAIGLLAPGPGLVIRLLGDVRVTGRDGEVPLPVGAGGALVRLLAVHPAGLELDEAIDALWPAVDAETGRRRLRDVRFRLRARCGDLVQRDGHRLRLVGCWVDAVAFRAAADRALSPTGDRTTAIAAALALWSGEPLPTDLYSDWAALTRQQLRRRHMQLLDAATDDAEGRNSLEEAGALLEEAIEAEPEAEQRYLRLADIQVRRRIPAAARLTLERAAAAAARMGLSPSPQLQLRLTSPVGGPEDGQ